MEPHVKGCACGGGGGGGGGGQSQRQSFGTTTVGAPRVDIPRTRVSAQQSPAQPAPAPPGINGFGSGSGSMPNPCGDPAAFEDEGDEPVISDKQKEKMEREQKESELAKWISPLRQFDQFATGELRRREIEEEDFPRLKVPQLKGHHRCRVSCLLNHSVDYAVEMEQELRNIGIQETQMMDMLEKLTRAEAAVRFQGAVRAAEVAAMSAPPELAEEAAVAGARGYSVETQEFSKSSKPGDNPIEIVGYIGCTRPNNF